MYHLIMPSRLGDILLLANDEGICRVDFQAGPRAQDIEDSWQGADSVLLEAKAQLDAYFASKLERFDLPLAPKGTPFQQQVWKSLLAIPYGETCSYARQAELLGNPKAIRAMASANGANPISIFIPCHRVIGKDGNLRGYAGGLDNKRALLTIEGALKN